MDRIGEKIGLFDFWAVFFPGAIGMLEHILFSMFLSCNKCSDLALNSIKYLDNVIVWIVVIFLSIFVGTVFQEIGRWIQKLTGWSNAMDIFLDPKSGVFSKQEHQILTSFFCKYGWDEASTENSRIIFHQISAEAQECGVATQYVKLSVIQNMSLSLSVSMIIGAIQFVVLLILYIIRGYGQMIVPVIIIFLLHAVFTIVFYKRFNRFNRYWVRNIVYAMFIKYKELRVDEVGREKDN